MIGETQSNKAIFAGLLPCKLAGGPRLIMRIIRATFEKINDLLVDGCRSFPAVHAVYPDIPDDILYDIYLRKAHHDARSSLRKISALKLCTAHFYKQYTASNRHQ